MQISIYNQFIQTLVLSEEEESGYLASLLVSNKEDFINWLWVSDIQIKHYDLPYITGDVASEISDYVNGADWRDRIGPFDRMDRADVYARKHFKRKT